MSTIPHR